MPTRRRVLGWLAATGSLTATAYAQQQSKHLRMIVPLSAGSGTDVVARALAPVWTKITGQPVIVENIVGAGGIIGTSQLVRAPKDGSTLLLNSVNHALNPSIYKTAPFDALRDVTLIGLLGSMPLVLVANPSFGVQSVDQLRARVRANPGKFNEGSVNGTILQIAGEAFKQNARLEIMTVPYKTTAQLLTDVMGGELLYTFVQISSAAPFVRSRRLIGLAVTSSQRADVLPELPTMTEVGLPAVTTEAWLGLFGPSGLDNKIVDRVHDTLTIALKDPDLRATLATQGMADYQKPRSSLQAFLASEISRYKEIVDKAGIKIN